MDILRIIRSQPQHLATLTVAIPPQDNKNQEAVIGGKAFQLVTRKKVFLIQALYLFIGIA